MMGAEKQEDMILYKKGYIHRTLRPPIHKKKTYIDEVLENKSVILLMMTKISCNALQIKPHFKTLLKMEAITSDL